MSQITKSIIGGLIIAAVSGSMGYGFSQAQISKDVVVMKTNTDLLRLDFVNEQHRTDDRIFRLTELMNKQAEQNTEIIRLSRELVTLIKVQNQVRGP